VTEYVRKAVPDPTERIVTGGVLIVLLLFASVAILRFADNLWIPVAVLTVALAGLLVIGKTRLVIPLILVALALEITAVALSRPPNAVELAFAGSVAEYIQRARWILSGDAGRLAISGALVLWLLAASRSSVSNLVRSPLAMPVLLLLALYVLSLTYTNNHTTSVRQTLDLMFLIGLFFVVPYFVRDRGAIRWALMAVVATALALTFVGLLQQATDTYFWHESLAQGTAPRRNATFWDPNIFARFIVMGTVIAIALFSISRRPIRVWFLAPAMILGFLMLPFTGSRSAWIIAAAMLATVTLLVPMRGRAKEVLLATGLIGGLTVALLGSLIGANFIERAETVDQGLRSIGPRYYLIQAGWQMFIEHPVSGLGAGSFRVAMEGPYSDFIWPGSNVVKSHTTAVTMMAEFGMAGLIILIFLLYRVTRVSLKIYLNAGIEDRAYVAAIVGALAVVFLGSQTEGRLFEDPYLWVSLGLLAALYRIRLREARNDQPGLVQDSHPSS
jgi:O-antigen ligase